MHAQYRKLLLKQQVMGNYKEHKHIFHTTIYKTFVFSVVVLFIEENITV